MVDSKITALTALTTVADDDVLAIIDDTAGTPTSKKITKKNLVKDIVNADVSATAGIVASKLSGVSTPSSTDTLTNKTIDQDGTGNSITNIADASIKSSAAIAQSKIANLSTDLALKSPLASPTFTGTVVLPSVPAVVTTELNLKSPLASPTFTGTVTTAAVDVAGNNIDNIQNLIHDTSSTTTALDFSGDQLQTISISANTTFTTSNRAIGKSKTIKITTDATLRTLTFPSWKFVGAMPTDQAASKVGILTVTAFGTADTDIVAAYAVEE